MNKPLIKGSGTDTDYDGAEDWNEVNVDLIYQLKPSLMGKKALLMDDMPTINEIIGYYDQAYVQSGLDRLTRDSLQYSSNPVKGVYRQSVAPIRSNPVDPDSDNDGVIDSYDSKELNGEVNSYKEGCDVEKAKETSFTVLKVFDLFEQGQARENVVLFSHPGGKIIGENKLTAYENVCISSIIMKYNGNYDRFTEKCEYWLKIKTDNIFSYVKVESISNVYANSFSEGINKFETVSNSYKGEPRFITGWYIPNELVTGVDFPINIMSQTLNSCPASCLAMAYNYFIDTKRIKGIDRFFTPEDKRIWNGSTTWYYPEGYDSKFVNGGNDIHLYATLSKNQIPEKNTHLIDTISEIDSSIEINLLDVLRENLDNHLPVLISCRGDSSDYNHFVLVVGYMGEGKHTDNFLAIDPLTYRIDGKHGDNHMPNAQGAVCTLSDYFSNGGFNKKYNNSSTGIKYIQFDFTQRKDNNS